MLKFLFSLLFTPVEYVNVTPLEIIFPPRQNNIFFSGMSGRNTISEVRNRGCNRGCMDIKCNKRLYKPFIF